MRERVNAWKLESLKAWKLESFEVRLDPKWHKVYYHKVSHQRDPKWPSGFRDKGFRVKGLGYYIISNMIKYKHYGYIAQRVIINYVLCVFLWAVSLFIIYQT
jgi:hypothetical protein